VANLQQQQKTKKTVQKYSKKNNNEKNLKNSFKTILLSHVV